MNMSLPETQYGTEAQRLAFHEQMRERVSEIPGIQEAALVTHVPYSDGGYIDPQGFSVEGRPLTQRNETRDAIIETTSPSYFHMMNLGLRDGRYLTGFGWGDLAESCGGERESGAEIFRR